MIFECPWVSRGKYEEEKRTNLKLAEAERLALRSTAVLFRRLDEANKRIAWNAEQLLEMERSVQFGD